MCVPTVSLAFTTARVMYDTSQDTSVGVNACGTSSFSSATAIHMASGAYIHCLDLMEEGGRAI